MGCVSSRIMTRSRSFQEELSLGLQRRTNGMTGLEDIVAGKNGGGEQFLALLSTANTLATKLRVDKIVREQGKFATHPSEAEHGERVTAVASKESEEPTIPEVINAWELMADLEEEEGGGVEKIESEREQHLLHHPTGTADGKEGAGAAGDGVSRPRSFRTVEDFDVVVAGNCSPPGRGEEEEQTGHESADKSPDIPDGFARSDMKVKAEVADMDPTSCFQSSSTSESIRVEGEVACSNRSFAEQKGLRRRAMAKELRTLKVPSFEFNSVGSLREWLGGGGQVFSPASYVTPKFGNVISPPGAVAPGSGGDSGREETLFDPQLVADLEEAMEQLTMEEEHILRQIVESLQGEHEEEEGERADGGST